MSDAAANGERAAEAVPGAPPFGRYERMIAGRYLFSRKAHAGVALISIISFVGILLAVAVLIIVMSVMNGFRAELLGKLLGAQGHVYVYVDAETPEQVDEARDRITVMPGVLRAAPVVLGQAGAQSPAGFRGVVLYGLSERDMENLPIVHENLVVGSLDGFGEGERGGDLIIVGSRIAGGLNVSVGDRINLLSPAPRATAFGSTLRQKAYEIAGVVHIGMSQIDEIYIYIPIEQARLFLGRDAYADFIEITVADPDAIDGMVAELRKTFGPDVLVQDWRDRHESYFHALKVERNVMRLILMMIVLIAALNIISGLVMLVKNKGRDIAILRTMGATQGAIMRTFFMSGSAVGLLGTLAGLIIGVLFCLNIGPIQSALETVFGPLFPADVYFLDGLPAKVEWSEVGFITLWSLAMSCLATLLPAWNAARLDPVEALRYE